MNRLPTELKEHILWTTLLQRPTPSNHKPYLADHLTAFLSLARVNASFYAIYQRQRSKFNSALLQEWLESWPDEHPSFASDVAILAWRIENEKHHWKPVARWGAIMQEMMHTMTLNILKGTAPSSVNLIAGSEEEVQAALRVLDMATRITREGQVFSTEEDQAEHPDIPTRRRKSFLPKPAGLILHFARGRPSGLEPFPNDIEEYDIQFPMPYYDNRTLNFIGVTVFRHLATRVADETKIAHIKDWTINSPGEYLKPWQVENTNKILKEIYGVDLKRLETESRVRNKHFRRGYIIPALIEFSYAIGNFILFPNFYRFVVSTNEVRDDIIFSFFSYLELGLQCSGRSSDTIWKEGCTCSRGGKEEDGWKFRGGEIHPFGLYTSMGGGVDVHVVL